jgi:glutathione reductase (NADPH)
VVDAALYATGRVPNVAGLGLEAWAWPRRARRHRGGRPLPHQRAQSVYALGDVTARVQLTPVALGEAMKLVDHLFGPAAGKPPRDISYDLIPTAVFTHPNVGTVGLTEAQARERFGQVSVFRSEFRALATP